MYLVSNIWGFPRDASNDLNKFKCIKTCFMAQNMNYLGTYSECTRKESAFCCCWVECSINVRSSQLIVLFKSFMTLFFYFSCQLFRDILKSPTTFVNFKMFPYSNLFHCTFWSSAIGEQIFRIITSSWWTDSVAILKYFFHPGNILWPEICFVWY